MDERYDKILSVLMQSFTVREAAQKLNCSEGTVYGALRDPVFQEMYKEARKRAVEQSISMLSKASSLAVAKLIKILQDDTQKPMIQVQAARTILEHAMDTYKMEALADKIAQLEEHLTTSTRQRELEDAEY